MKFLSIFVCLFLLNLRIYFCVLADQKPLILVNSGGATLPADVYKIWRPMYQAERSPYADVIIYYQAVGTAEGVKRFEDNFYDFAGSDFELPEADYGNATDIQMFPSVAGTVSITYNVPELPSSCIDLSVHNNPNCLNLTREAVVGIFNGTIRTWNHPILTENNNVLKNINNSILLILRADVAGATQMLTTALSTFSAEWKAAYGIFNDGCTIKGVPIKWNTSLNARCGSRANGATGLVINNEYSIGYSGSSEAQDALLPESRILNRANQWANPRIEGTEAAMDSMADSLGARLTGSLIDAPARNAYPIAGYSYFLLRKRTMTNCTVAQEIYRFFRFVLENSLAKTVVRDLVKAPVSDRVYKMIDEQVLSVMECAGKKVSDLVAVTISIENGTYESWKIYVAVTCSFVLLSLLIVGVSFGYVHYVKNKHILTNTYIIHIDPTDELRKSSASSLSIQHSIGTYGPGDMIVKLVGGEKCLAKPLCKHLEAETLHWNSRKLLVTMKDNMHHINIIKVMGICKRENDWKLITACPRKGRLQDIIHAGKYQLDAAFRYAIVSDLAEGMQYLHKQEIIHGQLTTNSCYVDARWNAQVGDWEQHILHQTQRLPFTAFELLYRAVFDAYPKEVEGLNQYCRLLFWTPSELLVQDIKKLYSVSKPTKGGDVYSFGIVAHEVFTGVMPFENLNADEDSKWQPLNVVKAIKTDSIRPSVPDEMFTEFPKIATLLHHTMEIEPTFRPGFLEVKKALKQVNPKHDNIVDSMIQAVETYASGLEEKVIERTLELEKITHNMENLLHNMLPPSIADKLSKGESVLPEYFDSVTVSFADIVEFTALVAASSPIEVVSLLNDLYSTFDLVISGHDVYKVDTIFGDTYMCVSGLLHRNGFQHASEIAMLSLDMLSVVKTMLIPSMPGKLLLVRIGVHSGGVMGGVVGLKMPRYCLFGETVNIAAKMKMTSLPMRIQISEATKKNLDFLQVYETRLRGERNVNGDSKMITYWLTGKTGYGKDLPVFDPSKDDPILEGN